MDETGFGYGMAVIKIEELPDTMGCDITNKFSYVAVGLHPIEKHSFCDNFSQVTKQTKANQYEIKM